MEVFKLVDLQTIVVICFLQNECMQKNSRGHDVALVKEQRRLDVRKYIFSEGVIDPSQHSHFCNCQLPLVLFVDRNRLLACSSSCFPTVRVMLVIPRSTVCLLLSFFSIAHY